MTKRMMAAVLYGKENLRIEEVNVPRVGPEEVLVKIETALTCGTDLKVYRQGYHARMIVPPAIFGHELAGVVQEVGEQVEHFREGMRVVAANSAPCDDCLYCGKGLENLCERLLFNNGAYAEFIRIPAPIVRKSLLRIPDHISYRDAALLEPLACVLRGLEETGLRRGDSLAVIGLGPIGLMFVRLAKLRGASVVAVGKRPTQRQAALRMGADEVIDVSQTDDPVRAVRHLHSGGVDVAIEAVGSSLTWQWATGMVRRGGTVNLFGGCPSGTTVEFDTSLLHYSEITLLASFHHTPYYIRRALDSIAGGEICGQDLVTGEAPLHELPRVLRHMMNRNGDLKTAILP